MLLKVEVKKSSIASEIECMGLKPYWVGGNIECLCKNFLVLIQINFSKIMEKVGRIARRRQLLILLLSPLLNLGITLAVFKHSGNMPN